jgi:hypothetical protein
MVKVINKVKELLQVEYNLFAIYAIVMTLLFVVGVVNIIIGVVKGYTSNISFDLFF